MKTVKAFFFDEATRLTNEKVAKVDFIINDAVEHLINTGVLLSDDEGVFFQRQLEYIQAQSYDIRYPELKGRTTFALNTEGGEGINMITYRSYDMRGETAIIAGKATDLPRGDISGKEYSITVKTLGNAFGYSRQELAAAKVTGLPLEARKAKATRRSYEEKVNQLIWFGSPDDNLHGFFNGPVGAPALTSSVSAVAAGAAGGLTWRSNKEPDEIIADLTSACVSMYEGTLMLYRPNKILISVANKQYLMNTPRNKLNDTSIMKWFLSNNDFITSADQFVDINELKDIYPDPTDIEAIDGTLHGFQGFTVLSEDSENMRIREPFPYMHLPVQYRGLEFEINCYGRFAGMEMVRPEAVSHHTGI